MELIRTPDNWDELTAIIRDMRGTQADLSRVAIMAYQLGNKDGWKNAHNELVEIVKLHKTGPLMQVKEYDDEYDDE